MHDGGQLEATVLAAWAVIFNSIGFYCLCVHTLSYILKDYKPSMFSVWTKFKELNSEALWPFSPLLFGIIYNKRWQFVGLFQDYYFIFAFFQVCSCATRRAPYVHCTFGVWSGLMTGLNTWSTRNWRASPILLDPPSYGRSLMALRTSSSEL